MHVVATATVTSLTLLISEEVEDACLVLAVVMLTDHQFHVSLVTFILFPPRW